MDTLVYHPVIPNRWFVNFNRLASEGFPEQLEIVQQGKASLSETTTFEPGLDFQSTKDFDFTDELLQAGGRGRYGAGEPLSYISYPVFDSFDGANKTTAAVLIATTYWNSYFQGIPDDVKGIVCVVSNSAGQAFTYQINGRGRTEFLGLQDHHDSRYDGWRLTAEYSTFLSSQGSTIEYTGVPVDDEFIAYKLEVYPSRVVEDAYLTNEPIYFALAIGAVFVLCAIIFVIYNKLVDNRQNLVMTTAVKSTAVVDSMFPSNVRDRLMENVAAPGVSGTSTPTLREGEAPGEERAPTSRLKSQPIADYFEGTKVNCAYLLARIHDTFDADTISCVSGQNSECTVFFADIQGFTAWCDTRAPVEVFTLLETLYGKFHLYQRNCLLHLH